MSRLKSLESMAHPRFSCGLQRASEANALLSCLNRVVSPWTRFAEAWSRMSASQISRLSKGPAQASLELAWSRLALLRQSCATNTRSFQLDPTIPDTKSPFLFQACSAARG